MKRVRECSFQEGSRKALPRKRCWSEDLKEEARKGRSHEAGRLDRVHSRHSGPGRGGPCEDADS